MNLVWLKEIDVERAGKSAEQDQTPRMYMLILFYTLRENKKSLSHSYRGLLLRYLHNGAKHVNV